MTKMTQEDKKQINSEDGGFVDTSLDEATRINDDAKSAKNEKVEINKGITSSAYTESPPSASSTTNEDSKHRSLQSWAYENISSTGTNLGICQGDCDSDNDCMDNLKCWQRDRGDAGPSQCTGEAFSWYDYCYDPDAPTGYFANLHIDEIFIITTHNSLALPGQVFSPNQNHGLATQFDDGIRGFNFDLYMDDDGESINTSHGGDWNYNPKDQIDDLISKLDDNKNEFIIIQLQSNLNDNGNELLSSWFDSRLVKNFDSSVVLGEYLKKGQQVLIVTDSNPNPRIGIHRTQSMISENDYSWTSRYSTPPMGHRRGPTHPNYGVRFMRNMNYFSSLTGTGDMVASYVVHDVGRALGNIREFERQDYTGGRVNTLMVDYYRQGDSAKGQYEIFMVQDVMRKAGSNGFELGQECKYTWDDLCKGDLECGKTSKWDDTYICCEDTIVPFGWTTDLCVQQNEGDLCGTT